MLIGDEFVIGLNLWAFRRGSTQFQRLFPFSWPSWSRRTMSCVRPACSASLNATCRCRPIPVRVTGDTRALPACSMAHPKPTEATRVTLGLRRRRRRVTQQTVVAQDPGVCAPWTIQSWAVVPTLMCQASCLTCQRISVQTSSSLNWYTKTISCQLLSIRRQCALPTMNS